MISEEMHIDLSVKWPLMLSNFNQTWIRSMPTHFSEIPQTSYCTQICSAVLTLLHADTWTNRQAIQSWYATFNCQCTKEGNEKEMENKREELATLSTVNMLCQCSIFSVDILCENTCPYSQADTPFICHMLSCMSTD